MLTRFKLWWYRRRLVEIVKCQAAIRDQHTALTYMEAELVAQRSKLINNYQKLKEKK